MLDAISCILSTHAMLSLKAYSFLSAGAKSAVCPIKLIPIFLTLSSNSLSDKFILYPGIDSNLSVVPPVIPKSSPRHFYNWNSK